jgi:hypothetical protein
MRIQYFFSYGCKIMGYETASQTIIDPISA